MKTLSVYEYALAPIPRKKLLQHGLLIQIRRRRASILLAAACGAGAEED
jgi:hypothetical protein